MKSKKVAFVFSGGGSRGAYQCGVWQALYEMGIHPNIVVGTSVGSINGAMCVQRELELATQLWRELETDMLFDVGKTADYIDFSKEFLRKGGAGSTGLQKRLRQYVNEYVVRLSPIDFGLVTMEIPMMKAHYLWKEDIPQGQLNDFITASCSAFPAVKSHEIDGHSYIDGGYADVMPISMARQKNPDLIIAVSLEAVGNKVHYSDIEDEELRIISPKWDLGNFLIFDTNKARRLLRLGYLDAMKSYNVLEGNYYAFPRYSWDKRTTSHADLAAKFFELDPTILYTPEALIETLGKVMEEKRHNWDEAVNAKLETFLSKLSIQSLVNTPIKAHLVIHIMDNLKEKGVKSYFSSYRAMKYLGGEIKAARFLLKYVSENK